MTAPISAAETIAYVVAGCLLAAALYRFREVAFRGIPDLSATALGLFRIAFGVALCHGMSVGLDLPDTPSSGAGPGQADLWAPWGWVEHLAAHPDLRDTLQVVTLVAIAAFVVGLGARLAFLLVLAGFVVRLLVAQEYGAVGHAWVLYPLALLPLVIVPWGDGLSLDNVIRRRLRRRRPLRPPGPHYGIAVWLPGLTLGCVWLAAAAAKLGISGVEWVTGGAVRYRWAEAHLDAPSSLGAWIAGHEQLAILCSAAGVAFEALFITHVLFRGQRTRLAYGLGALALFGAFYLFQGVFWYAWWTILLAFLPWEAIANGWRRLFLRARARRDDRRVLPTAPRRQALRALSPAVAVMAALLVTQQVAVSRADVEQMPFFSDYAMYATTWASPEAFNRSVAPNRFYRYRMLALTRGAMPRDITARLEQADAAPVLREAAVRALRHPGRRPEPRLRRRLAGVPASYRRDFGRTLRAVHIQGRRRVFDFDTGRLVAAGETAPVVVRFHPLKVGVNLTRGRRAARGAENTSDTLR